LYQPAQDVDVLCAEMVNRPLPNPPPNLDSGSHALNPFEWNHLRARCSILRVIDGDTLDAAVSFDPNMLIHQTKCVQTPTGSSSDRLWTVRLTLRLYGVDAAEKNTPEGKECIGLLVSHLEHIKSEPLMAVLCGNEKYGRTLAVLQRADGSFVNSFLVNAAKMCGRPLAKPYLGGAK
jgi:endonuclease YncB( thermonuclease family)